MWFLLSLITVYPLFLGSSSNAAITQQAYSDTVFPVFNSYGHCRYYELDVIDFPAHPEKNYEGDRILNLRQFVSASENCEIDQATHFIEVEESVSGETLYQWMQMIQKKSSYYKSKIEKFDYPPNKCLGSDLLLAHIESVLFYSYQNQKSLSILVKGNYCTSDMDDVSDYSLNVDPTSFDLLNINIVVP